MIFELTVDEAKQLATEADKAHSELGRSKMHALSNHLRAAVADATTTFGKQGRVTIVVKRDPNDFS